LIAGRKREFKFFLGLVIFERKIHVEFLSALLNFRIEKAGQRGMILEVIG
jgi:hypothetical protein